MLKERVIEKAHQTDRGKSGIKSIDNRQPSQKAGNGAAETKREGRVIEVSILN